MWLILFINHLFSSPFYPYSKNLWTLLYWKVKKYIFTISMLQALQEGREPDMSDYKEFKLTCENVGFQMLEKMGWKEGEGLGPEGQGIKNPINK